jgi:hypothetical protein
MSYGTAETEKLRTNVEEQVGQLPDSRAICQAVPAADRLMAGMLMHWGSPFSTPLRSWGGSCSNYRTAKR